MQIAFWHKTDIVFCVLLAFVKVFKFRKHFFLCRSSCIIFVSKDGMLSIDDKIDAIDNVKHVMYDKRVAAPQLTVSLKADRAASMGLIGDMHNQLREADALKVNYSSKVAPPL